MGSFELILLLSLTWGRVKSFHQPSVSHYRRFNIPLPASKQDSPEITTASEDCTARFEESESAEVETQKEDPVSIAHHSPSQAAEPVDVRVPVKKPAISDLPVHTAETGEGFNVVLTHSTADFDSLASAVGLAKLWSAEQQLSPVTGEKSYDSASHVPTFVVLPRGAHPAVQHFLALHKHLFPIRSLKSLPGNGLNRLALVDAQRRERLVPADKLLDQAQRITVVDHHVDQDSDIAADDYVVDQVGSVTTLIVERLQAHNVELTEAEATLMALGIHADTGSLCYDNTTPRDAYALAWCLSQDASQTAIAEHASTSLSVEQQGVLTKALLHINTTVVNGVHVSTVLLQSDMFVKGLAAVTQDALDMSGSDILLLGLLYSTSKRKGYSVTAQGLVSSSSSLRNATNADDLRRIFSQRDLDQSGSLDAREIMAALKFAGVIALEEQVHDLMEEMDKNGDGLVDIVEFVNYFENNAEHHPENGSDKKSTLVVVGRVKASANLKAVKLNHLLEPFGGGGHPKAASATMRVRDETEASGVLQGIVDQVVETSLPQQPVAADFMMSPVLSVTVDMTEKQVEDLFTRYDVRALPVVDAEKNVVGLVTYKEVAAAKQRTWNKEQKRLRREQVAAEKGEVIPEEQQKLQSDRKQQSSTVKAWMKQHVQLIEADYTMQKVESILLETDEGCMPVVNPGTRTLVGMVSRTDLLRQHQYYPSLAYHNKGMADSIAKRKPIIELRKRLKQFDLD